MNLESLLHHSSNLLPEVCALAGMVLAKKRTPRSVLRIGYRPGNSPDDS